MKEEKVVFPSGGIRLEGLLSNHEALSVKGGVILCHPHPQFGGDMHNSVISIAAEAAWQEGFQTLRFNFRGVGESEGTYGGGKGEQEDVKATIDFFSNRENNPHHPLIVLGYSFGAWAGLPVAMKDERVSGLIAVAPPLQMMDFAFLKGSEKRKLVIAGSRDPFCPTNDLEKWFQTLSEPKSLSVIQGADHFFSFHQKHLVLPLKEFLKKYCNTSAV
jgi:alpha/beta superfamily hydrolase